MQKQLKAFLLVVFGLFMVPLVFVLQAAQAAENSSRLPKGLEFHFATTRLNEGSRTSPNFGGSRHIDLGSGSLEYGVAALKTPAKLVVPSQTKSGSEYRIAVQNGQNLWGTTPVNFLACFEEEDFFEKVRKCKGRICVYIHGYDITFDGALRDAAMLFYDSLQYENKDFLPVLFTWPSAGNTSKYSVDQANLDWSRAAFEKFFDRIIKEKSPETKLDVVAHSMGNSLVSVYLQRKQEKVLDNLFMCSADIDFRQAESVKERLEQTVKGMVYIFVSDKDRPLIMSQVMHGEPRLGRPVDPPGKTVSKNQNAKQNLASKLKTSDFWLQLTLDAAEVWLGPNQTDTKEVLAWLSKNPALSREFGEKSRFIDVSDLALATMGHGLVFPVVAAMMTGKTELPQLKGRVVHKMPDSTYLKQCGGSPRVLYRFLRLDPGT